ncbi:hypothetical protein IMCC21906_00350 [Spongiibacter sp. IMCC21906]|jgi:DNA-binding FadR family transcriptional regulator|uniref:hypothetical protein n=1 Tax=Spongiibacter sp. IMCC21906 TaxID=1620392 RepID=UPI00062DFB0F|nr:hypothetical protein [Spongiibacter sp. IMCC21906]AKH68043.1 hypothetical protein IMCC21906_00350 [Spongiibacter sp. IMCC21906]
MRFLFYFLKQIVECMKKTDKKYDKAIREALSDACNIALEEVPGFSWLTHQLNYSRFPQSLVVTAVFDTEAALSAAIRGQQDDYLRSVIKQHLASVGIVMRHAKRTIHFDSEEACQQAHSGNWQRRLSAKQAH